MKIINGDKAYIQKKDLVMLSVQGIELPKILFNKIDSSEQGFIGISDPKLIKFIEGLDILVDYKTTRKELATDLFSMVESLSNNLDSMLVSAKDTDNETMKDILKYQALARNTIQDINMIAMSKFDSNVLCLPDDGDVDGLSIKTSKYNVVSSISANEFYISKNNGKDFFDLEELDYLDMIYIMQLVEEYRKELQLSTNESDYDIYPIMDRKMFKIHFYELDIKKNMVSKILSKLFKKKA